MPQQTIFTREWLRSSWLRRSALSLTVILLASGSIHAATLAKGSHAADSTEPTRDSASVVRADVNGETVANGKQLTLEPGSVDGTRALLPSKLLKEVGKQAIDQPGHFLIAAAPIWASRCLVGVPWYGWIAAPLLAYREWLQWPSNRWWDPPLDWIFLTLGAVVATFRRPRTYRVADGLQPLRRRIARALSFAFVTGRRTQPATI